MGTRPKTGTRKPGKKTPAAIWHDRRLQYAIWAIAFILIPAGYVATTLAVPSVSVEPRIGHAAAGERPDDLGPEQAERAFEEETKGTASPAASSRPQPSAPFTAPAANRPALNAKPGGAAAGPKPPSSRDPFTPTDRGAHAVLQERYRRLTQPPDLLDQLYAKGVQPLGLYQSLEPERRASPTRRPPRRSVAEEGEPPIRMAGIIHGARIQAILAIAGSARAVVPGETVGPYRVERIEPTRTILSRPGPDGEQNILELRLSGDRAGSADPQPMDWHPSLSPQPATPPLIKPPLRNVIESSDATAGSPKDPMWLEYERSGHIRAPSILRVHLAPVATDQKEVHLLFDRTYLDYCHLEQIAPQPNGMEAGPNILSFTFRVSEPGRPMEIRFHLIPQIVGDLAGWVGMDGGTPLRFNQAIDP